MRGAPAGFRLRCRQSAGPPSFWPVRDADPRRSIDRRTRERDEGGVTDFFTTILDRAASGEPLSNADALALAECDELAALMRVAAALRDTGHGGLITYSRKVFIPLTQ